LPRFNSDDDIYIAAFRKKYLQNIEGVANVLLEFLRTPMDVEVIVNGRRTWRPAQCFGVPSGMQDLPEVFIFLP
jgi:hypothetical protein